MILSLLGFPVGSAVKNPPETQEAQETWVQSLGQEDSPGERNGNPLQYSCVDNPMDGGAWWATAHGVAKSRTRLGDFTSHYVKVEGRALGHTKLI